MNRRRFLTGVAAAVAALAGCGYEVAQKDRGKLIECVSGAERFTYSSNTVKVRASFGVEATIDLVDTEGWKRTMTQSEASRWKCR